LGVIMIERNHSFEGMLLIGLIEIFLPNSL